jgi:hypothetical protein
MDKRQFKDLIIGPLTGLSPILLGALVYLFHEQLWTKLKRAADLSLRFASVGLDHAWYEAVFVCCAFGGLLVALSLLREISRIPRGRWFRFSLAILPLCLLCAYVWFRFDRIQVVYNQYTAKYRFLDSFPRDWVVTTKSRTPFSASGCTSTKGIIRGPVAVVDDEGVMLPETIEGVHPKFLAKEFKQVRSVVWLGSSPGCDVLVFDTLTNEATAAHSRLDFTSNLSPLTGGRRGGGLLGGLLGMAINKGRHRFARNSAGFEWLSTLTCNWPIMMPAQGATLADSDK